MPEQTSPEARRWRLQGLIVDGPSLQIHQGDKLLSAEPTQVASLLTLIEAWPEIVDKNTLIDRVWGQRIVSDSAVHKTISLLRQQLREAGADDLIETRHRLGYRLTQPPQALDQQAPTTQRPSRPRSRKPQWPRFVPAWLWGLPILVVIGLIAWYWLIEAPTSEEPGSVEAKPPAVVDHSAALSGRDIDTLIELARSSMPDDLAFADQALTIARRQLKSPSPDSTSRMAGRAARASAWTTPCEPRAFTTMTSQKPRRYWRADSWT
jgi:DNA-binding winged helix-turn-helix (wHTH) protein